MNKGCSDDLAMSDSREQFHADTKAPSCTWKNVGRMSEAPRTMMVMTWRPLTNFAFKGFGGGCLALAASDNPGMTLTSGKLMQGASSTADAIS